jgi:hypothetical protein
LLVTAGGIGFHVSAELGIFLSEEARREPDSFAAQKYPLTIFSPHGAVLAGRAGILSDRVMESGMDIDWESLAVEAALFALVCFGFGVAVGYAWRARMSRLHRLIAKQDRKLDKRNASRLADS